MSKSAQDEKIEKLQVLEHNLQGILAQKQQFQSQLFEVNSALEEIDGSEEVYKILGGVLLRKKKEEVKKELEEKRDLTQIRITTIEKQEKKMREQAQTLQEEVVKKMQEEEKK